MVEIAEMTGDEVAGGLRLLVDVGFRAALQDGLTSTEILLGATDDEGQLIGALRGSRLTAFQQPVVALLGVTPPARKRGIGTALLGEFCLREFTAGADLVEAHVAPGAHETALADFYEKCGFHWTAGVYIRRRGGSRSSAPGR